MTLLCNNISTDTITQDYIVENVDFVQCTKYTRTDTEGGKTEYFQYIASSNGKTDVKTWSKNYLSEGKEALYQNAMRNLFRKLDFIELNQSLEMEDITEDDYNKELEQNEDKYLIPAPNENPTIQQIIQIADIVKRLGREKTITVDEVSEIFSLKMDKAEAILNGKTAKTNGGILS